MGQSLRPKSEGGLINKIEDLNATCLAKQDWKIFTEPNNIWVQYETKISNDKISFNS